MKVNPHAKVSKGKYDLTYKTKICLINTMALTKEKVEF